VELRDRRIAASKQGAVSIDTQINTALVHWLAEEGDARPSVIEMRPIPWSKKHTFSPGTVAG